MGRLRSLIFEVTGWLLVVGGIAALVLPGPGLLMIFGGLALLSQRYEWAERRLDPVRLRALRGAAESVETWPRIVMSLFGATWIGAVGLLWLLQPDAPDWWPVAEKWWLIGGPFTGATLLFSCVIAFALLAYSWRRFRGNDEARAALDREIEDADREVETDNSDRAQRRAQRNT